jgi:pre-rRNA-processing protein TSR3
MPIPVTVIRHADERLAKCSLTPLHGRAEITFLRADGDFRFDATGFTVLAVDAPLLTVADAVRPLLLPDSTWRLLPKILRRLDGSPVFRSLPAGARTAYPRKSKIAHDPDGGLASVEALYLAKKILDEDDISLLENYYWRAQFLAANAALLAEIEKRG